PENTVRVWQESRGLVVAPTKPNWGRENALRGDFAGGGEPEHLRVLTHRQFSLPFHVAQAPLAGGHHQPAPGLIPKPLPVRLTAQIRHARAYLLTRKARVVLGRAVNF